VCVSALWVDVSLCECKSSSSPKGSLVSRGLFFTASSCTTRPERLLLLLLLLVNPTGMSHQNSQSLDSQALTTHA